MPVEYELQHQICGHHIRYSYNKIVNTLHELTRCVVITCASCKPKVVNKIIYCSHQSRHEIRVYS